MQGVFFSVLSVWDFPSDQLGWSDVCARLKVILTTAFRRRSEVSPLIHVPAALRDGGQLRDASVAVQVLGGAAGHDPLQPSVVGFAALRGGVVGQAQRHPLAPQQQLAVADLKEEPSSAEPLWVAGKHFSVYRSPG